MKPLIAAFAVRVALRENADPVRNLVPLKPGTCGQRPAKSIESEFRGSPHIRSPFLST